MVNKDIFVTYAFKNSRLGAGWHNCLKIAIFSSQKKPNIILKNY